MASSPAAQSGTARKRREQKQRAVGRHVRWLFSSLRATEAHHTGLAQTPGPLELQVRALQAEVAELKQTISLFVQASPSAADHPVLRTDDLKERYCNVFGEKPDTFEEEIESDSAMLEADTLGNEATAQKEDDSIQTASEKQELDQGDIALQLYNKTDKESMTKLLHMTQARIRELSLDETLLPEASAEKLSHLTSLESRLQSQLHASSPSAASSELNHGHAQPSHSWTRQSSRWSSWCWSEWG